MPLPIYDTLGRDYSSTRRPDPRIAAAIDAALGDAATVANIGAGTGSYEPTHRSVIAIEPSEVMIRQRPAGSAPCRRAFAESLPLESSSVDAAMTVLSAHHWTDFRQGLREMARVAKSRVVMLTWVPDSAPFWLTEDYFPEIAAHDRTIFATSAELKDALEQCIGPTTLAPVPVPHDCIDGFLGAFWCRPDAYLNPAIRDGISSFAKFNPEPGVARLRDDLHTGRWSSRNRHLLKLESLDLGYRLVHGERRGPARS